MTRPPGCRIAVVIPAFNEESNVKILADRLLSVLKDQDFQIIFVDDGSTDGTLAALKEMHSSDSRINYISFSRNFGHQAALKSGLDKAIGDCVISMDADLQHPPELIPKLIEKWEEGYDIVYTVRTDNGNTPALYRFAARTFYAILNSISEIKLDPGSADFRLLDRGVLEVLKTFHEPSPFLRGILPWLGFRKCPITYEAAKRQSGKSKYSFKAMVKLATSGITSFSIKPLQISTYLGILISFLSFLYASYAIYARLFASETVPGWTSVLVSVLFIGGVQLIILGIIGQYLGMLFLESKRRPGYVITETSLNN